MGDAYDSSVSCSENEDNNECVTSVLLVKRLNAVKQNYHCSNSSSSIPGTNKISKLKHQNMSKNKNSLSINQARHRDLSQNNNSILSQQHDNNNILQQNQLNYNHHIQFQNNYLEQKQNSNREQSQNNNNLSLNIVNPEKNKKNKFRDRHYDNNKHGVVGVNKLHAQYYQEMDNNNFNERKENDQKPIDNQNLVNDKEQSLQNEGSFTVFQANRRLRKDIQETELKNEILELELKRSNLVLQLQKMRIKFEKSTTNIKIMIEKVNTDIQMQKLKLEHFCKD